MRIFVQQNGEKLRMSVRIDKFIWFVRLAKTRTKASELVSKGKVKLNGESVKPSANVKIGDKIGMVKHSSVFTYKVKDYLERRVGAKLVEGFIVDITQPEEIEKYKAYQLAQSSYRRNGTGKPTTKERRDLDKYLEWDELQDELGEDN